MTLLTGIQSRLRQRTIEQDTDEFCNDIGSDNDETDGFGADDEGYDVQERKSRADDEEDDEPPTHNGHCLMQRRCLAGSSTIGW